MDLFGITIGAGLACLAIAGIVALSRPIDNWRPVAIRIASVGAVLALGGAILRAIAYR
jgi:hypothetical protein